MQYSRNGSTDWHESDASFSKHLDRAAKIVGVKKGEFIYWREYDGAKIYSDQYGKRYGK